MYIDEGAKAPPIHAKDQYGKAINLEDYLGSKVILFFYPKASTPGCTAEACNLSENFDELTKKRFRIIGVSADDEKKQKNFSDKYNFPYPLIADSEKKVIQDYGVWGPKKLYGRGYEGIHRTTYVISENGFIEHVFKKVKTKDHTAQILKEY